MRDWFQKESSQLPHYRRDGRVNQLIQRANNEDNKDRMERAITDSLCQKIEELVARPCTYYCPSWYFLWAGLDAECPLPCAYSCSCCDVGTNISIWRIVLDKWVSMGFPLGSLPIFLLFGQPSRKIVDSVEGTTLRSYASNQSGSILSISTSNSVVENKSSCWGFS